MRAARRAGAQVAHFPTYRGPVCARSTPPTVVTVLDLAVLRNPAWFTAWARIHARTSMPATVRAAAHVIAISRQTADDVVSLLGVPASRVSVVECGIDAIFSAAPERTLDTPPYLLGVATPEPRKNLPRLLEAFELVRARGDAGAPCPRRGRRLGRGPAPAATRCRVPGARQRRGAPRSLRGRMRSCTVALGGLRIARRRGRSRRDAASSAPTCRYSVRSSECTRPTSIRTCPQSIADGIVHALAESPPEASRVLTWERAARLTAEIWRDVAARG